jgi:hypothetical protein
MMKLSDAILCMNCDEVFSKKEMGCSRCPKCTSNAVKSLSLWIVPMDRVWGVGVPEHLSVKEAAC